MTLTALRSTRTNIVVGLFLVAPVVLTILILNFLLRTATDWIPVHMFPRLAGVWNGYLLRLLALCVVLAGLYAIGLLARSLAGRFLYQMTDRLMSRIPIVRSIYLAIRQISETLAGRQRSLFREVVLVQFPTPLTYAIAFVTTTSPETISNKLPSLQTDDSWIVIFIPTTPNPTSGFLLATRRSNITPLGISVSDAMTFIMSGGVAGPGQGPSKPLIDQISDWTD